MSFENFQLTTGILQELYKNHLYQLDEGQGSGESLQSGQIPGMGNNRKGILILVDEPSEAFLKAPELDFLLNILKACQLGIDDVALVNINNTESKDYKILLESFPAQTVIFFGIEPAIIGLPLHFPAYQVQSFGKQQYLSAPALSALSSSQEEKKLLWNALKKLFSI